MVAEIVVEAEDRAACSRQDARAHADDRRGAGAGFAAGEGAGPGLARPSGGDAVVVDCGKDLAGFVREAAGEDVGGEVAVGAVVTEDVHAGEPGRVRREAAAIRRRVEAEHACVGGSEGQFRGQEAIEGFGSNSQRK